MVGGSSRSVQLEAAPVGAASYSTPRKAIAQLRPMKERLDVIQGPSCVESTIPDCR